jgi:glutamate--cysteine ligase
MESFFDSGGSAGRVMMRDTAALQINIDLPDHCSTDRSWRMMHGLGPVLAAAFANSPFQHGRPTGCQTRRLANWLLMDPTRCSSAFETGCAETDWINYVLRSRVMLIRTNDGQHVPVLEHMSFERWMAQGHELGFPDAGDLRYHLSTLFPPVRPRGWFELRAIDAVPTPWWQVATLITWALLIDEEAFSTAERVTASTSNLWAEAARLGLSHPPLQIAARRCFEAGLAALDRAGLASTDAVHAFADRFVNRARSPADERLSRWETEGSFFLDEDVPPVTPGRTLEAMWI